MKATLMLGLLLSSYINGIVILVTLICVWTDIVASEGTGTEIDGWIGKLCLHTNIQACTHNSGLVMVLTLSALMIHFVAEDMHVHSMCVCVLCSLLK